MSEMKKSTHRLSPPYKEDDAPADAHIPVFTTTAANTCPESTINVRLMLKLQEARVINYLFSLNKK